MPGGTATYQIRRKSSLIPCFQPVAHCARVSPGLARTSNHSGSASTRCAHVGLDCLVHRLRNVAAQTRTVSAGELRPRDQHWLAAEREVLAEMTAHTSAAKTISSHTSGRHT